MSFRVIVGRRPLPVGLPTLAQVQALAAQADAAAQTAAADAVADAQPLIETATQQAADAAVAAEQQVAHIVAYGGGLVASLDNSFLRDVILETDNSATAEPWFKVGGVTLGVSAERGAMTITGVAGTPGTASASLYYTSSTTFFPAGNLETLVVSMRLWGDHIIHSQGTYPRIRVGIAPVSDTGVVGTYAFGPLLTMTGAEAEYIWRLAVPAGSKRYVLNFQFGNFTGTTAGGAEDLNTVYLKKVKVRNGRTQQVLKSTEGTMFVDSFAAALALTSADVSGYSTIRVSGAPSDVFYKVAAGTYTYSCKSLGASVHLIPGDTCDLRLWTGEPNGTVTYSGPAGFEDEVVTLGGVTNCWPTFVAAMRWCISRSKELLVPEGNFYCYTNSHQGAYVGSGLEALRIRGMGRRISNLLFDDFYRNQPAPGYRTPIAFGDVGQGTLRDLSIIGNWRGKTHDPALTDQAPTSAHMMSGTTKGAFTLDNVEIEGSGMFSVSVQAGSLMATGCRFAYAAADGLHVRVAGTFQCTNNVFYRVMDDAVAYHPVPVMAQFPVVEQLVVVAGNTFDQTSGIWANGFSRAIITNNVGRNINGRFIGTDTAQRGSTEIIISHNICENNFHQSLIGTMGIRDADAYPADYISHLGGTFNMFIGVSAVGVFGSSSTETVEQPFIFEANANGIASPNGRFDRTGTVAPGQWMVSITNNIYRDSLVDGLRFSGQPDNEKGGTLWSRYGKIDPIITRYSHSDFGIYCTGLLRDVMIAGNILHGLRKPIVLGYSPGRANGYNPAVPLPRSMFQNVTVSGNTLSQFLDHGIFAAGAGIISVHDNSFDGDPLHLATNRRADGGFDLPVADVARPGPATSYADAPTGMQTATNVNMPAPTLHLSRNRFRNLYRVIGDRLSVVSDQSGLIFGDLVAADSPSNKGIRQIGANPVQMGSVVTVGSDPANPATYGATLATAVRSSDTRPVAGFYSAGQIVSCSAPAVDGGTALVGWLRRTTGAAHTAGVDWSEIRVNIS